MDNCNDYFFPSIAHVCAWDSAKNKFDASWCFNREYSLFPYRYIPSYCGTFVLDSYLSWYQLIHRKNNRGGQISVNGDIELSLYSPHEGYGQNQLQLRVNTTFPSSFTEFIHPTQRFENFTLMNFDTLTFAVSAEPNTTFAMYFGTSTSMNSTTQAVPSKKIFSNLYHNFTSSNSSYTFILPLKEFNVDSNVLLQSINFVNFSSFS
ncbi:hypothetical protein HMI55_005033 [Coelomomyces lativittatus]|nr:hypothetical protein HMI55_005033 [Coelomomyces lativittatus]